jgi:hypothetical protein
VVVDANGQLGTVSSSRRFKQDIQKMGEISSRLLDLNPVTFRYRNSDAKGEKPLQFGLIAEEVAEVFPELVVYDQQGRAETVAYHLLASLLLNEVQKERKLLTAQADQIVALRAQVTSVADAAAKTTDSRAELAQLRAEVAELRQIAATLVARSAEGGLQKARLSASQSTAPTSIPALFH